MNQLVLAAVFLAAGAARADTLPEKLDLDTALKLFHEHGFDLLIADAQSDMAAGDVEAAEASPNPALSLGYGASFTLHCTDPAGCPRPPSAFSVQLSDQAAISDALSGKRGLRGDVARAALRAAKLSRGDADRQLSFQVKTQFARLVFAQSALRFARETAAANAVMLDKAQKQRDADKIQRPDLLRVRVTKLESDQAVDVAEQAVAKARTNLAFLLGVRTNAPALTAIESGLEHFRPLAIDREQLIAQAMASRPDLAAQREQIAAADKSVALANRNRVPDLALSLGYAQQGTTEQAISPPTFSIGLSFALPLLYRQQGEIHHARANELAQTVAAQKLEASIENDVDTAYADYLAAQRLVQRMEGGGLLEAAHQAKDDIELLYEKGSAQLTDYLLALATYIATDVEYLTDLEAYWTAVFELELAVGKTLR